MATEHITRTGDEYNVELLPSDDDAPPLESSWRLNLDAFQLPSSTGGRHDGRTRFSRYFRTPRKERRVSEYYKKQERLLEGFNEMETIHENGFASGVPTEEEMKKLAKSERLAVHISNATNLVLFVAKVYASMESRSMAVIASTLDSLLDLLSGFILWFTANAMRKPNQFHYPIGKRRMQPVGIIVFASVMATLGLQVLLESGRQLVAKSGIHMNSTEEKWMIGIMVSVTIVKFLLMLYCRGFQNEIVRAYAQDHLFDVVTNSIGLATAVLAVKFYWWIDPTGAILIALYTIATWARTVLENVHSLIGRSAPPDFLAKLTFLIWNHHEQIKHIDTVRAYTFGSHYFVEVDIVLPEDMRLQEAHNIGETLQIAAAFTSMSMSQNRAYADSRFRFPFFSSSPPAEESPTDHKSSSNSKSETKPDSDEPKGSGFDPESLERGAKALREINSSPHSKQVFDLMRKQEKTRLAELAAEKEHNEAIQASKDIERQRKLAEDQRNLVQQQAQAKAQNLRYEDELARKRMQTDNEAQRRHNAELVSMQEASSIRKEKARIATEEQIQAQQRETEKERAELERETIRVKAMAEAEGRAHEAKLTEEQNRRMLLDKINGEREKWLAAINTTFSHIEGGVRTLLTDRSKLIMTVGGVTALAAGVYTTREGARVTWGYINRILGQPSLIRESSMGRFPWAGSVSQFKNKLSTAAGAAASAEGEKPLENVILHRSLKTRIERLARATANTKSHKAPFRNMMFYGPPGTGKTMVAREIARKSGLDYAMMTGGDVAPLGAQAVTKIHEIFDWAKKSNKGLLLFIDEADAFLCERNSTYMSEAQRSALNALLFRTGDQSRDIVLVLATNRPGDLDSAVTDRIDEVIEFPLPGEEERFKLLKLYLNKYLMGDDKKGEKDSNLKWSNLFKKKKSQKITIEGDLTDQVIKEAAKKTEGFSGREIAKLVAGVQAAVYGRQDCVLDSQLFEEIVDYKIEEHHQRIRLATEGGQSFP